MKRSEKLSKLWIVFFCIGIVFAIFGVGLRELASSIETLTFVNGIFSVGIIFISVGIAIKLISYIVESIEEQTQVLKRIERHLRSEDNSDSDESDDL